MVVLAAAAVTAPAVHAQSWTAVYTDNYAYSAQSPDNTTFNTWFWREDSAGSHDFQDTARPGCSVAAPCVVLTARAVPHNTDYTNAEMYNNSCMKDAGGALPGLEDLPKSVWGVPLYRRIVASCAIAYPYQETTGYNTPFGVTASWTATQPAFLEANPFALTKYDAEPIWEAVRDIAFNNPYVALDPAHNTNAIRLTAKIRAETTDQGGSRGWGFWNTTFDPKSIQLAWFMEYSIPETIPSNGKPHRVVVMQTIGAEPDGTLSVCSTRLADTIDIYQWHSYRIEWLSNEIKYYVDGQAVATHGVQLTRHMAFHNWVDNRDYFGVESAGNFALTRDKANIISAYTVETASIESKAPPPGKDCQTLTQKEFATLAELLRALAKAYQG